MYLKATFERRRECAHALPASSLLSEPGGPGTYRSTRRKFRRRDYYFASFFPVVKRAVQDKKHLLSKIFSRAKLCLIHQLSEYNVVNIVHRYHLFHEFVRCNVLLFAHGPGHNGLDLTTTSSFYLLSALTQAPVFEGVLSFSFYNVAF